MLGSRLSWLALSFLVVACASSSSGTSEDELGDLGRDQVPTSEPAIGLGDGYSTLFDLKREACAGPSERPPTVGQPLQQTTIRQVQSDIDLAKELGVDASLAVKAPTANASASASLVQSFKASSSNVSYVIQAVQSYVVASNGGVALNDRALGLLQSKPEEFLTRCGDRYVSSVVYSAKIVALITYETSSEDRALKLAGSINAGAGVGPAQVDGSISAKLSDASKNTDVKSSIRVIAQGFDLAPSDALIGISGTIEDKLKRIDVVGAQLASSLQADRAKDAANYLGNTTRAAVATSIGLKRYGETLNSPPSLDATPAFQANRQNLQDTETFLRAFGSLKLQFDHAYRYEISDFLNAGPEAQATYNLAPPAAPKRFSSELAPIVRSWAARFRGDDGVDVGTDVAPILRVIGECAENAKAGDFSSCYLGTDGKKLPEYVKAKAAVQEYLDTGRVLKMRYYVINTGGEMSYQDGLDECLNHEGWVDRLPSAEEAQRLAPLVAGYGGGTKKAIWIADMPSCRFSDNGMSTFSNPIDGGQSSTSCTPWQFFDRGAQAVICVPQSGPVGNRPAL